MPGRGERVAWRRGRGALVMLGACACAAAACGDASAPVQGACGSYDALVATSNVTSSEIGNVSLDGKNQFLGFANLGIDPVVTSAGGDYFWINRYPLGEIYKVDPDCLNNLHSYDANDTNVSANPQDVAVAPDGSLWIARFGPRGGPNVPSILVLNPDGTRKHTVSLAQLDPEDGNPNAASIKIVDPTSDTGAATSMTSAKAYVSLEILDDKNGDPSTRRSRLARIDLNTYELEESIELKGQDPFGLMVQVGRKLYLADVGYWCSPERNCTPDELAGELGQPVAGVEEVDTHSFTSRMLVTGEALHGHVTGVAVTSTCAVAVVAGTYAGGARSSLVSFDFGGAGEPSVQTLIPTQPADNIEAVAWLDGSTLLMGYGQPARSSADSNAIHVFDRKGACSLTERPQTIPTPQATVGIVPIR